MMLEVGDSESTVEFSMNHFHSAYLTYNYCILLLILEGDWLHPDKLAISKQCHTFPLIPQESNISKIWNPNLGLLCADRVRSVERQSKNGM